MTDSIYPDEFQLQYGDFFRYIHLTFTNSFPYHTVPPVAGARRNHAGRCQGQGALPFWFTQQTGQHIGRAQNAEQTSEIMGRWAIFPQENSTL